jgi:hypothetical protein
MRQRGSTSRMHSGIVWCRTGQVRVCVVAQEYDAVPNLGTAAPVRQRTLEHNGCLHCLYRDDTCWVPVTDCVRGGGATCSTAA